MLELSEHLHQVTERSDSNCTCPDAPVCRAIYADLLGWVGASMGRHIWDGSKESLALPTVEHLLHSMGARLTLCRWALGSRTHMFLNPSKSLMVKVYQSPSPVDDHGPHHSKKNIAGVQRVKRCKNINTCPNMPNMSNAKSSILYSFTAPVQLCCSFSGSRTPQAP